MNWRKCPWRMVSTASVGARAARPATILCFVVACCTSRPTRHSNWHAGDSDGHVLKWAVDVAELLQGSSQAVVMVKSCHVGAPVSSLASTPTTSKLAAVTKSSRFVFSSGQFECCNSPFLDSTSASSYPYCLEGCLVCTVRQSLACSTMSTCT